jgi:hypothetical protein
MNQLGTFAFPALLAFGTLAPDGPLTVDRIDPAGGAAREAVHLSSVRRVHGVN